MCDPNIGRSVHGESREMPVCFRVFWPIRAGSHEVRWHEPVSPPPQAWALARSEIPPQGWWGSHVHDADYCPAALHCLLALSALSQPYRWRYGCSSALSSLHAPPLPDDRAGLPVIRSRNHRDPLSLPSEGRRGPSD